MHCFSRRLAESLISYKTLRTQTASAAKKTRHETVLSVRYAEKFRSNDARIKRTHREGFHGTDKLLAIDFGVGVTVT